MLIPDPSNNQLAAMAAGDRMPKPTKLGGITVTVQREANRPYSTFNNAELVNSVRMFQLGQLKDPARIAELEREVLPRLAAGTLPNGIILVHNLRSDNAVEDPHVA